MALHIRVVISIILRHDTVSHFISCAEVCLGYFRTGSSVVCERLSHTLNPSVGYISLKCDSFRNVVRNIDLCVGG